MNKLVIGGIVFTLALLGIVFSIAGGQDVDMSTDTVNLYSAIAAVVIVAVSVAVVLKYVNQMQNDKATGDLADHEWDSIKEYKNELPTGWAVMFLITLAWFFYYLLVKYPVWSYSQIGEYNEEVQAYNEKFEAKFKEVESDPAQMLAMGKSVFSVNCAPCHGVTADGLGSTEMDLKAANLTHRLDYVTVKHTILNGSNNQVMENGFMSDRNGLMNANNDYAPITDAEIETVSKYVAGGFNAADTAGAAVFAGTCSSCHGLDGKGMQYVAPSIRTFEDGLLAKVINGGKKGGIGTMPAFAGSEAMNANKIKAVAAYVKSLQGAN